MEIEVCVNAVPVQLIQQIVLPLEHDRVQCPPAVDDGSPYPARRGGGVVVVHPHPVDSQFGQVRSDLLSVLVAGEVGTEAEVYAPDSQAAGPGAEMSILDAHKAISSCAFWRKP